MLCGDSCAEARQCSQSTSCCKAVLVQVFLSEVMVYPLNAGELPKAQLVLTDPPYGILDPAAHPHDTVDAGAVHKYVVFCSVYSTYTVMQPQKYFPSFCRWVCAFAKSVNDDALILIFMCWQKLHVWASEFEKCGFYVQPNAICWVVDKPAPQYKANQYNRATSHYV
jgi:hypothetical protein